MVVIIQAAPTDWISEPKFEERLAIQIVLKVSFLNGASGDVRSVTSSTFLFDKNRLADPVIGEPVVNASHCIDPRRSTYVFNLKEAWECNGGPMMDGFFGIFASLATPAFASGH
ncbi:MAG: hypothetical protein AAAC48_03915 [Phyllobacterium sp.]|jgi:hypothetical protein|uniref:hypothetical protein n=1 Tax=Phyllobacterium sp. TaxID=1871046 RepID=UPI0030F23243